MTGNELLQLIGIGVIAGAFGQGLRAIVGIKKASDRLRPKEPRFVRKG